MASKNFDPGSLGRSTKYVSVYTPSLLHPIPRAAAREEIAIDEEQLPFSGVDIWTAYELSWLDNQGKPQVAVGRFTFACTSKMIVESKSFKLYLNSFNQTRFASWPDVIKTLESDLSVTSGAPVMVELETLAKATHEALGHFAAESIDNLAINVDSYEVNESTLIVDDLSPMIRESLCSDLLKTNCPVTGQPDWASVYISYHGKPIQRKGLLQYIVSFREHQDFHENCVERIFIDLMDRCQPKDLTVYARYTRRGGLDINPFRTNCNEKPMSTRLVRQ